MMNLGTTGIITNTDCLSFFFTSQRCYLLPFSFPVHAIFGYWEAWAKWGKLGEKIKETKQSKLIEWDWMVQAAQPVADGKAQQACMRQQQQQHNTLFSFFLFLFTRCLRATSSRVKPGTFVCLFHSHDPL